MRDGRSGRGCERGDRELALAVAKRDPVGSLTEVARSDGPGERQRCSTIRLPPGRYGRREHFLDFLERLEDIQVGADADDHAAAAADPLGQRLATLLVLRGREGVPEALVGPGADDQHVHGAVPEPLVGKLANIRDLRRLHPAAAKFTAHHPLVFASAAAVAL